ncbi:MAG: FkbM family methyltransferase [Chitinophagales bacterium]|nr:FkbM family methyltransferase [Chitinophagales bacterium]MCZ2392567.1 FkbM family methyltransferase [Chitinophagales bacterium]
MDKIIKKWLFRILGFQNYIRLLYRGLAFLLDFNFLKNNSQYALHQFASRMIRTGDSVLDVGGNLGYYTRVFLKAVGPLGKVYVVEPVKPFFDNIQYFLGQNKNLTLWNYALGTEQKSVQLSIPKGYGYLRTGLPKVVSTDGKENNKDDFFVFEAPMIAGSQLFSKIISLDYLKMDIEGYEKYVIPEIKDFLKRTQPVIQIEIQDDSQEVIESTLLDLGYIPFYYENGSLTSAKPDNYSQDYFFIHPLKMEKYQFLIK